MKKNRILQTLRCQLLLISLASFPDGRGTLLQVSPITESVQRLKSKHLHNLTFLIFLNTVDSWPCG